MRLAEIEWNGETFTIKEDDVFRACDAVEEVITLGELGQMSSDFQKIKFAKLAAAYSALLVELGANVTPKDVHQEFQRALCENRQGDKVKLALEAINWLTQILLSGVPESEGDTGGNVEAPAS